jgi:hypothetical protein
MKNRLFAVVGSVLLMLPLGYAAQTGTVSSGTEIDVRADNSISATSANVGKTFTGRVTQDVHDANGNIVIPKGSRAQMTVQSTDKDNVTLALRSVSVNGQRYMVDTSNSSQSTAANGKDGIGMNKRTGEYVGGGALAGTVIGAIAGGAKGAAIGALAGGAAGAGAQVLTKGKKVDVPAETILQFRLANDLQVGH